MSYDVNLKLSSNQFALEMQNFLSNKENNLEKLKGTNLATLTIKELDEIFEKSTKDFEKTRRIKVVDFINFSQSLSIPNDVTKCILEPFIRITLNVKNSMIAKFIHLKTDRKHLGDDKGAQAITTRSPSRVCRRLFTPERHPNQFRFAMIQKKLDFDKEVPMDAD